MLLPATVQAIPFPSVIVESNISFALKMYINYQDELSVGNFDTQTYATVTVKNADIIRAYADYEEENIGKTARLIKQEYFDEDGNTLDIRVVIREKDKDDIFLSGEFIFETFGYPNKAEKYKYSQADNTGSRSAIERNRIHFFVGDEEDNNSDEYMDLICMDRVTQKVVAVNEVVIPLETRSSKITGDGEFYTVIKGDGGWRPGLMEGTCKVSGSKAFSPIF